MQHMLGKRVTNEGKTWRIASIRQVNYKPWAWLVNTKKPAEQVRLSLSAECFSELMKKGVDESITAT